MSETTATPSGGPAAAASPKSYLSSAKLISACIFLSRILGLVRDLLSANVFGAGWVMDAFVLAFRVPNLFRKLFGEGALSAAVIPVYADHLAHRTKDESNRMVSALMTLLAVFLTLLTVVLVGVAAGLPAVVRTQHPEKLALTCHLLMAMLPYLPLVCGVAVLTAVLNCHKHFLMPSLASVVLNLCWIAGFLAVPWFGSRPETQVFGIACAIVVGGVLELALQVPPLGRHGVRLRPTLDARDPGVREVLRLMGPTVFGLAIIQVNLLVDSVIAETCVKDDGAVSALFYGDRLMQFPLALIGIALAQAVFPFFADHHARGETRRLGGSIEHALRISNFVSIPAMAGLCVLAQPIVELLFLRGRFDARAAERTSLVVVCYASGVWSYCAVQVLARAFYAMKDPRTPVRAGVASVAVNLALNLTLVWPLREAGIALSTAIASVVNQVILRRALAGRVGAPVPFSIASFARPLLASALMAALCWGLLCVLPPADGPHLLLKRLARVLPPLAAGVVAYGGIAWLLRAPELADVLPFLRRRMRSST